MPSMQNWLSLIMFDEGPKYAAISDAISGAIRSGELRPGERLPAQRKLAHFLGVDLTTVTRAYGLLSHSGLIEGSGKLGSFVRNDVDGPIFDGTRNENGMNVPPQPGFNLLSDAIRTATSKLLRAGRHSPILQYQPGLGNYADRFQAAAALSLRGIPSNVEQMAIVSGAQNALHAIVTSILKPGDRICCAHFVYPGIIMLAHRHRLKLSPIAVDAEGLVPEALDECLRSGVRFIYVTPTNDNPTALTMGIDRRAAISAIARQHGATIIEDDAYGLLPSLPYPPIASIAAESTWYITGTSKLISPVIRVAHVRAPSVRHATMLERDICRTTVMAPPLNAAIVTMWLRQGTYDQLVAGVRSESIQRQRLVNRHLAGHDYIAHREGYHLWLKARSKVQATTISGHLRAFGLSAVLGNVFMTKPDNNDAHIRISVGGAISHDRLERALSSLSEFAG